MTVLEKIIKIAEEIGEQAKSTSIVGNGLNGVMNIAVKLLEVTPYILLLAALAYVVLGIAVYEKHKTEGKGFVILSLAALFLYGCFSEKYGSFAMIMLFILSSVLGIIGNKMTEISKTIKRMSYRKTKRNSKQITNE